MFPFDIDTAKRLDIFPICSQIFFVWSYLLLNIIDMVFISIFSLFSLLLSISLLVFFNLIYFFGVSNMFGFNLVYSGESLHMRSWNFEVEDDEFFEDDLQIWYFSRRALLTNMLCLFLLVIKCNSHGLCQLFLWVYFLSITKYCGFWLPRRFFWCCNLFSVKCTDLI